MKQNRVYVRRGILASVLIVLGLFIWTWCSPIYLTLRGEGLAIGRFPPQQSPKTAWDGVHRSQRFVEVSIPALSDYGEFTARYIIRYSYWPPPGEDSFPPLSLPTAN